MDVGGDRFLAVDAKADVEVIGVYGCGLASKSCSLSVGTALGKRSDIQVTPSKQKEILELLNVSGIVVAEKKYM